MFADCRQLYDLCALTDTLIGDEDGLYDPHDFNDRLVLKGTMTKAELHVLKSRHSLPQRHRLLCGHRDG